MVSVFIIVVKVLLEYVLGSLILGFIMVSSQYKPSANFLRQFVVKSDKQLMNEVLVVSLIIFVFHLIATAFTGEVFFLDLFVNFYDDI